MPLTAEPPDFCIATSRELLWCSSFILRWMPLGSHFWINSCKICFTRDSNSSTAIGTTAVGLDSVNYSCSPFMSSTAQPPNVSIASPCYVINRKFAVKQWMPFTNKGWCDCLQIIDTQNRLLSSAIGTTMTIRSITASSTPFMTLFTDPPKCLM